MPPPVMMVIRRSGWLLALLGSASFAPAMAQGLRLSQDDLQKRANGVLAIMSFSIVPDITTSSLNIGGGSGSVSGSSEFAMTQLGGGDTISKSVPIYLEGVLAASRYDPTFVATQGAESRSIPTKWNSFSATGGIGWDFKLTDELKLRPIFNFALGNVTSDLRAASWYVGQQTGKDISFLDKGSLNAYGLGGSLMLDYEHYPIRTGNAPAEPEAGAHLHSLRGAYAMIHETALADRCAQMEDLARNRRTDALAEALDVFEPMALAALAGRHPRDAEK
ncbi:hypothetical protein DAI43_36010 [Achromobacter xylosoxidans]|nr:hypothetical protein DAI43_36010 [Achromobacter xylosoxidans]